MNHHSEATAVFVCCGSTDSQTPSASSSSPKRFHEAGGDRGFPAPGPMFDRLDAEFGRKRSKHLQVSVDVRRNGSREQAHCFCGISAASRPTVSQVARQHVDLVLEYVGVGIGCCFQTSAYCADQSQRLLLTATGQFRIGRPAESAGGSQIVLGQVVIACRLLGSIVGHPTIWQTDLQAVSFEHLEPLSRTGGYGTPRATCSPLVPGGSDTEHRAALREHVEALWTVLASNPRMAIGDSGNQQRQG